MQGKLRNRRQNLPRLDQKMKKRLKKYKKNLRLFDKNLYGKFTASKFFANYFWDAYFFSESMYSWIITPVFYNNFPPISGGSRSRLPLPDFSDYPYSVIKDVVHTSLWPLLTSP